MEKAEDGSLPERAGAHIADTAALPARRIALKRSRVAEMKSRLLPDYNKSAAPDG